MYIPEHFKETNPEHITALIADTAFGMLITIADDAPFVSHLPLLFEHSTGTHGKLLGHMARANPQWQHFSAYREILAVFQGPHTYISPSHYATPGVPTWNYAVIHLRGIPRLIDDITELAALIERQTQTFESGMPSPWEPDLTGERHSKLLDMIVGFEIEITDVQAKFKLSQNRSPADRQHVIDALNQSGIQNNAAVAQLMTEAMHDTNIRH